MTQILTVLGYLSFEFFVRYDFFFTTSWHIGVAISFTRGKGSHEQEVITATITVFYSPVRA